MYSWLRLDYMNQSKRELVLDDGLLYCILEFVIRLSLNSDSPTGAKRHLDQHLMITFDVM